MFELARKSLWLQNLYISCATFIHPSITHQIAKIEMIKRAFHLATMEYLEGDYYEFGVYEGASMLSAVKAWDVMDSKHSKAFSKFECSRKFYGFDSFEEGFKYDGDQDNHPLFVEGGFSNSYEQCIKRFRKYPQVKLIKGFYENTVRDKKVEEEFPNSKCAVLLIDCDLYHSALDALLFMRGAMQEGTIIILDDNFCYKGDPEKGVNGAWLKFLELNPKIKAREYMRYGTASSSYIIYSMG